MINDKKFVFGALLFIAVVFVSGCVDQSDDSSAAVSEASELNRGSSEGADDAVKEVDMIAKQWEFNPDTITVNEGDTVRINIESVDVPHGFAILEFGVNEFITPGKTTTFEFVAAQKGTYDFFCSVQCGAGHGGMRGKLIVE